MRTFFPTENIPEDSSGPYKMRRKKEKSVMVEREGHTASNGTVGGETAPCGPVSFPLIQAGGAEVYGVPKVQHVTMLKISKRVNEERNKTTRC